MSDVNKFKYSIPLKSGQNSNDEKKGNKHETRKKPTSKFSTKEIRPKSQVDDTRSETINPPMCTSSNEFHSAHSSPSLDNEMDNVSGKDSFISANSCEQYEDAKSTTEVTKSQ